MLAIRCTLLRDVFEGGRADDPRSVEWPPSWMRLFSALVSVAEPGSEDDRVLRHLEAANPPDIRATEASRTRRSAFVPTNRIQTETRHATLVARTNGERAWARCAPRSPEVWYRWRGLQLDPTERERLASLCRRVPYLGRSTSPVIVEPAPAPTDDGWLVAESTAAPSEGTRFVFEAPIRSPQAGTLDELRAIYEAACDGRATEEPWQVGVGVDYGHVVEGDVESEVEGPYVTVIVFELESRRLDGRHTARVTHAVRRAVMSRAGEHLATLHGHHGGDVVQCAFLGLPDVGHRYADGHLLGVGIAVPDLPDEELAVVAGAIPEVDGRMEVTAGPLGRLVLRRMSPVDSQRMPLALRPSRWTAPSRRWATVTPIVLDRFLKPHVDPADEVAAAVVNSRLPEPERVMASRHRVIKGSAEFTARDTLRRQGDRAVKPYRHAVIDFGLPVRGPVVVGSMRHYGLGLCMPLGEDVDD